MIVAPHHLAAKTGSDILKEGGNAIEAIIASAAMISVVYPHMNSMGGDNFWLISDKNKNVHAIDSCGPAANNANIEFYKKTIENDDKFIISDGCHRLSILLFNNYSNIHEYVTLK